MYQITSSQKWHAYREQDVSATSNCGTTYVVEITYDVRLRELGGAPAAERFADVLFDGDEHGEDDQQRRRVLTIQSVDEIVVGA